MAHESPDLGNLGGSTGILHPLILAHTEVRHGSQVLRDHPLIDHLLVKADRRLGHGHGRHTHGKNRSGAKLQIVGVWNVLLTTEERAIIEGHRIGLLVHQLAHIALERSHDLADSPTRINALVLNLHHKRNKRHFTMLIGQLKRRPDVIFGSKGAEGVNKDFTLLIPLINLPNNNLILFGPYGDSLAPELGILKRGKTGSLACPALDLSDQFLVLIIELVCFILIQAELDDMAEAITVFDVAGVMRDNGKYGVNRVKAHGLRILVPSNLEKVQPAHQGMVDGG